MKKSRSPWCWIPTLYVAEGLPYFAVNTLTVLMYTNLKISIADMAFYTGWLYLPWVIKPFWSPFVDIIGTKRGWTIAMQALLALSMAAVAFFLPTTFFFASTLACFWLMAFCSATHDIAADGYYMLELTDHEQAAYVGVRSTFYRIASVIGQGGLVILAGWLEQSMGNVPAAWSMVFLVLSAFFVAVTIYHSWFLPKVDERTIRRQSPTADEPVAKVGFLDIIKGFGSTFSTFFAKPGIVSALCFMLFYRFPEAMCIKLVQPFLVSSREMGGLALTTAQVGVVNGTTGVVALLAGGILGGLAIARNGLKAWLWPMALSLTLPCFLYCVLAILQPESFFWINVAVAVEQFGYGFGFTAFMLYLIYFSQGEYKTSHYAFCTAFMALGMMLPGMAAGWIHQQLSAFNVFGGNGDPGFINFFFWIMLSCVATFIVCRVVKIDPSFGRKEKKKLAEG